MRKQISIAVLMLSAGFAMAQGTGKDGAMMKDGAVMKKDGTKMTMKNRDSMDMSGMAMKKQNPSAGLTRWKNSGLVPLFF